MSPLTPHIKQISKNLASLSHRGVLPSLGTRGRSRRSGRGSRKTRLEVADGVTRVWAAAAVTGKRLGTLAPITERCKVGLVGLLRGRSRWARKAPSVPNPE
ncbi:hypothetical protein CDL15_Pgr012305 [Punica granatum]|uniref:Uncharacterized protein n=1 Tax=Punica granatum TaxID=22663 RepID=A0A218Y3V6_PUNGR|nr:hypothetical protein CDL15_Pgr012342 [Punica granatum]OWM91509.1 hypothetical protein CDL15_Pgr012305 [Punica granatum]